MNIKKKLEKMAKEILKDCPSKINGEPCDNCRSHAEAIRNMTAEKLVVISGKGLERILPPSALVRRRAADLKGKH